MKFEKVAVSEKTVAGVSNRVSSDSPDCSEKIGELWKVFFSGTFAKIANKTSESPVCLYSDVWSDKSYLTTVGAYINENGGGGVNAGLTVITIPAGEYAKFKFHGNAVTACIAAWETIAKENLDLLMNMTFSFEDYICPDGNQDECDIEIYIKL